VDQQFQSEAEERRSKEDERPKQENQKVRQAQLQG
jgi:hypothetical protein